MSFANDVVAMRRIVRLKVVDGSAVYDDDYDYDLIGQLID